MAHQILMKLNQHGECMWMISGMPWDLLLCILKCDHTNCLFSVRYLRYRQQINVQGMIIALDAEITWVTNFAWSDPLERDNPPLFLPLVNQTFVACCHVNSKITIRGQRGYCIVIAMKGTERLMVIIWVGHCQMSCTTPSSMNNHSMFSSNVLTLRPKTWILHD